MLHITCHQENTLQNNEILLQYLSEWPKSETLMTLNADKNVDGTTGMQNMLAEMQNTDTMKGKSLNHPHLANVTIQNSYLTSNPSLCLIPIFPSLWIKVKSCTLTLMVKNLVVFRVKSELTPPTITTSYLPIQL